MNIQLRVLMLLQKPEGGRCRNAMGLLQKREGNRCRITTGFGRLRPLGRGCLLLVFASRTAYCEAHLPSLRNNPMVNGARGLGRTNDVIQSARWLSC